MPGSLRGEWLTRQPLAPPVLRLSSFTATLMTRRISFVACLGFTGYPWLALSEYA
jgi:hypothetical protein